MFLDSAQLTDVEVATNLGYVNGITTNPTLLARAEAKDPLNHLHLILERFSLGPVLYQPCATTGQEAEDEALVAFSYAPKQVGIKLLAQAPYFEVARKLSGRGIPCAMTAVYSPGQAILASDAGCRWVIPYVDRAQKQMPEGTELVSSIRAALSANNSSASILAASIKSGAQAMKALLDGAVEISASLDVLQDLASHPLTASAAEGFAESALSLPLNFVCQMVLRDPIYEILEQRQTRGGIN